MNKENEWAQICRVFPSINTDHINKAHTQIDPYLPNIFSGFQRVQKFTSGFWENQRVIFRPQNTLQTSSSSCLVQRLVTGQIRDALICIVGGLNTGKDWLSRVHWGYTRSRNCVELPENIGLTHHEANAEMSTYTALATHTTIYIIVQAK